MRRHPLVLSAHMRKSGMLPFFWNTKWWGYFLTFFIFQYHKVHVKCNTVHMWWVCVSVFVLCVCMCVCVYSVQFSLSVRSFCDPLDYSKQGLPVHRQLPECTQTHVHWVGDTIQPSHPLSSPSPPALNLSQHQGLFKSVSSLHQVTKVLEFQLQHQSFQWLFRTDFL